MRQIRLKELLRLRNSHPEISLGPYWNSFGQGRVSPGPIIRGKRNSCPFQPGAMGLMASAKPLVFKGNFRIGSSVGQGKPKCRSGLNG